MVNPFRTTNVKPLSVCALVLLLGACQAKELFDSSLQKFTDKAKLSTYSFTPADRFAVLVDFAPADSKSLHQPVVWPLTQQLAVMLGEEIGVTGVGVTEAEFAQWRENQLANRVTPVGEKPTEIDDSQFFRQAGYRGFMRVIATELVDGAARNDFDYSLRTKFTLRVLETTEKGDVAPALAQFTTIRAVCSRRDRSRDTSSQAARLSQGYELTNVERCAATPVYRAKLRLAEEK